MMILSLYRNAKIIDTKISFFFYSDWYFWLTCKTPSHNSFVALLTYLGFQVMLRFCSSALGLCSNAFVRQSKKVDVIVYFCYIILISESSGNILSRIDNM